MKIASLASLLLVVLTSALPLEAEAPPPAGGTPQTDSTLKIAKGQSIAFLGDSITAYGWQYPGGYVKQVVAGFKSIGLTITPIPAGVSGNTSVNMLARLQKDVLDRKPAWMTLSCGVNDVWHKLVDLDAYKQNITSIVDQAQAAGIKVMILTATPIMEVDNDFNQRLAPYNDFLRQLAKDRKLPLVDMNAAYWEKLKATPPAPGTTLLTVDGVHPNPEGNFLFAKGILEGFGVTPAQVAQYEAQWRQSDNAAGIYGGTAMANGVMLSPEENDKLLAAAKAQKTGPFYLEIGLCYRALVAAVKAHEQDPESSPALNRDSINTEMNKDIVELIDALPPAPADATPPTATPPIPPASTASPSTAPTKPTGVRFGANMFMGEAVPVSLATYKNVVATAQARKVPLNQFAGAVFLHALINTVKAGGDQVTNLDFNGYIGGFVPKVYRTFDDMLKALPPADTTAPAPAAPATPPAR